MHGADEKSKKESVNEEDIRVGHVARVRVPRVVCSTPGCVQQNIDGFSQLASLVTKYSWRVYKRIHEIFRVDDKVCRTGCRTGTFISSLKSISKPK